MNLILERISLPFDPGKSVLVATEPSLKSEPKDKAAIYETQNDFVIYVLM